MRIAVLSDVHGNAEALTSVLQKIDETGVDRIYSLGDTMGYGGSPNECADMLRERGVLTVLGNHDAAVIRDRALEGLNDRASYAVHWTRSVVSQANREWLEGLPMVRIEKEAMFVHASPYMPEEWLYVTDKWDAQQAFMFFDQPVCFIGHTHNPFFMRLQGRDVQHITCPEADIVPGVRHLVNVGSVGQPRDRDPRASFVVADFDAQTLVRIRVEYDIAGAQAKIMQRDPDSDWNEALAGRLAAGR